MREPAIRQSLLVLFQARILRVGVNNATGNHRKYGADILDRVVRHGEVVVGQNDEVGVLAEFQRSQPALLAEEPSALDGGVAKCLLAREPLSHGYSRHARKK